MEQKRGAELSDSALEGVAGGINTVSSNTMSINDTYSAIGPAPVGPSAGPAGGSSCKIESAGGKICLNQNIMTLLQEAGTIDLYYRDVREYNEQCEAWDKKYYADFLNSRPGADAPKSV